MTTQKGQTQVLILAGIVLAVAVAGGIFYLGRTTAPKPQAPVATSSPQPSPLSTAASAKVEDLTANWKIYTDQNGLFSIKYPNTWSLFPSTMQKVSSESLNSWLASKDKEVNDPQCPDCFKVFSQKQIKIDGDDVIVQEVTSHPSGREVRAYISKNSTVVLIFGFPVGKNDPSTSFSSELLKEFDQILSTFRFLP